MGGVGGFPRWHHERAIHSRWTGLPRASDADQKNTGEALISRGVWVLPTPHRQPGVRSRRMWSAAEYRCDEPAPRERQTCSPDSREMISVRSVTQGLVPALAIIPRLPPRLPRSARPSSRSRRCRTDRAPWPRSRRRFRDDRAGTAWRFPGPDRPVGSSS
jgi:hypothetical protein